MFAQIANLAKTAASFLQSGVHPPNTPPEQQAELGKVNHLTSKKFFLTFSGFLILGVFYASSVAVLYTMKEAPALVSTYSLIFSKTIEVFATIMAVYLGGQALVDLKYNSSSSATTEGKTEVIETTTRVLGKEKEDDYTLEVKK